MIGLETLNRQPAHKSLGILPALGVLAAVFFAKDILFPILVSFILYFLFAPLVRLLKGWRIPKAIGAALIVFVFAFSSSYMVTILLSPVSQWLEAAPQNLKKMEHKLSLIRKPLEKILKATTKVEELASVEDVEVKGGKQIDVQINDSSFESTIFNLTSNALTAVVIMLVLLFFLLLYADRFLIHLGRLIWKAHDSEGADGGVLIQKIEQGISIYLVTFSIINVVLSIALGCCFWVLDLPNPFVWGAVGGLLNFFPYIGPAAGVLLVAAVSLVNFNSLWVSMLPPAFYLLINSIEGQFITPILLGRRLQLSPLVIFLFLIFWAWAWGPQGALIAVPVLAIIKIISDELPALEDVSRLLEK